MESFPIFTTICLDPGNPYEPVLNIGDPPILGEAVLLPSCYD